MTGKDLILLTGDGSIQMNLQELQTIIHHEMNIKIFLINNGGYHSIRQTQKNFFGEPLVGIGVDSGDLSFRPWRSWPRPTAILCGRLPQQPAAGGGGADIGHRRTGDLRGVCQPGPEFRAQVLGQAPAGRDYGVPCP